MADQTNRIEDIEPRGQCAYIHDNSVNVVVGPPTVKLLGAVRIVSNGEVVGQVDAVFDFSKLPSKYHQIVVQLINRRTNIGDWLDESWPGRHTAPEEPKSWWRRLWGSVVFIFAPARSVLILSLAQGLHNDT